MRNRTLVPFALAVAGILPLQAQAAKGDDNAIQDLLQLLNTPVVSASKGKEKLADAPATMVVLTQADLRQRGYTELDQILDDLPGMDVVRSYGADYVRNYWRGYRSDIADPYLVLIDGQEFNHLWYGNTETPLVTYPISAIERVEIVYGPASSVYGANAFMGVINIITRKQKTDGFTANGSLTVGSFATRIADVHAAQKSGDFSWSVAFRADHGDIDKDAANRFLYTSAAMLGNTQLWGAQAVQDGKGLTSPHQNTAVDLRMAYGKTEFGYQQLVLSTGYGMAYPADESQMNGLWVTDEYNFFMRHSETFGDRVTGTTLVRYRRSGLDPSSWDIESSYAWGIPNGQSTYSRWGNLSSDTSVSQDFTIETSDTLTCNAGFKFDAKVLQKAYADPGQNAPGNGAFPPQPILSLSDTNHYSTENRGVYGQVKWKFAAGQHLTAGLRSDNNNIYGTANTVRGGYVGTFGAWGFKALYGQAYEEPSGRYLFGGIGSTGSNTGLRPERSNTAEASASYTVSAFGVNLDVYDVNNTDKIVTAGSKVFNLGSQEVKGADLGLQWLVPVHGVAQWKLWSYYSHYFRAKDTNAGVTTRSPDLADNKVKFGSTLVVDDHLDMTLLARFVGSRPTIASNPVGVVDSHTTLDFNANWQDFWIKGLGISLRVANLANAFYYDPGMRNANAGVGPAGFNAGGTWVGSNGYYNSLLPQPGRSYQVSVRFDF